MLRRLITSSAAAIAGACFLAVPSFANANVISNVGTGTDSIQVYFNWPDAFNAHYYASYGTSPTATIDGYDATQIAVNADPNLTVDWANYGTTSVPNYFLNDATYTGGHTSVGLFYSASTPENYWHEWINYGSGWVFGNGASADTLAAGDSIGWVFGSNASPVPEPCSLALMLAGTGFLARRNRR